MQRHQCSQLTRKLSKQSWLKLLDWYKNKEAKFPDVINFSGGCVTEKLFSTWLNKNCGIPLESAAGWFSDIRDGFPAEDYESLTEAHDDQKQFTSYLQWINMSTTKLKKIKNR